MNHRALCDHTFAPHLPAQSLSAGWQVAMGTSIVFKRHYWLLAGLA
jgi:hypothetical protein